MQALELGSEKHESTEVDLLRGGRPAVSQIDDLGRHMAAVQIADNVGNPV